jgi:hypothetical protein
MILRNILILSVIAACYLEEDERKALSKVITGEIEE